MSALALAREGFNTRTVGDWGHWAEQVVASLRTPVFHQPVVYRVLLPWPLLAEQFGEWLSRFAVGFTLRCVQRLSHMA